MAGLYLYTSNRLESLVELLARVISEPPGSPFAPEIIVVQSKGMEKWVRMNLASLMGVSANLHFPFPNAMLNQIFEVILGTGEDKVFSDPGYLTWLIMSCLSDCMDYPQFEDVKRYISDPESELKWYQLARQIANCFDQYQIYRPELILEWENGKHDDWQAVLWRKLVNGREPLHRARLKSLLITKIKSQRVCPDTLPNRLSIFGISTLPPFHMEVFSAVARFINVNIFLMNPCMEYWADIVSDRHLAGFSSPSPATEPNLLHYEQGNSLLASMGTLGRDFQSLVMDLEPMEMDQFEEIDPKSLLTHIQSDILHLKETSQKEADKPLIPSDDHSIQIHSCHSPMREMEVLYDQLLHMFERNPELMPKDIVVMAPDIEAYAPYIQAVFGVPYDQKARIPFSIADRSFKFEGQIGPNLLRILMLNERRFKATEVLELLETKAIRQKFELTENDIHLVRTWIAETRIRWGIDEEYKKALGFPGFKQNTWQGGLERLLLGYALPGEEFKLFKDILPYDHIEGSMAIALGKLSAFTRKLFDYLRVIDQKRTLSQWSQFLLSLMDDLFLPDEQLQNEYLWVRGLIMELGDKQGETGFESKTGIEVVREYLKECLQEQGVGRGFLSGGVTFCAMLPMRSIPFRVVCLVGMNFDAFPRQSRHVGFDLMALNPRRGDRSKRNDDRYLFLESILSARDSLYISYVGQSPEDNSIIPPSPLVSELMDYIQENFAGQRQDIIKQIITKHPLQAFSPAYFGDDSKLFSYSEENLNAVKYANDKSHGSMCLVNEPIGEPEENFKSVDVETFIRFFINPAKFFLKQRLNVVFPGEDVRIQDYEPLEVKDLEKYHLEQSLIEKRLAGKDFQELYDPVRAAGILPHGKQGKVLFQRKCNEIESFMGTLKRLQEGEVREPIDFSIDVSGMQLNGIIGDIYSEGLLIYRYSKVKPKDFIGAWIKHLVLNYVAPADYPGKTLLLGKDALYVFNEVQKAQDILCELANIYICGISKPIHFFPETALEYAKATARQPHNGRAALEKAVLVWKGSLHARGESEDDYFNACFGNMDPLDNEFTEISLAIFGPMLESYIKTKIKPYG